MDITNLVFIFWVFILAQNSFVENFEENYISRYANLGAYCLIATPTSYKHYKVFLKNKHEQSIAQSLQLDEVELLDGHYSYDAVNYLVSPQAETEFRNFFTKNQIQFKKQANKLPLKRVDTRAEPRSISNRGDFNFGYFFTYDEMVSYLNYLSKNFADIVTVKNIGTTYENRTIFGVIISNTLSKGDKPVLFFDAGIHAREWFSPTLGLYMLNQFVENITIRNAYLPYCDIAIIPLVNPDGYTYAITEDPYWRKNRRKYDNCMGVDLNRNFDIAWGYNVPSYCHLALYPGPSAFSESETRAVRDFALSFPNGSIQLYVALHSYGQFLLYAYGYKSTPADDEADLKRCALVVNKYLKNLYELGSAGALLPPYSGGGADDYFKDVMKVKYSFTMELTKGHDFHLPEDLIEEELYKTIRGIYGFFDFIVSAYAFNLNETQFQITKNTWMGEALYL